MAFEDAIEATERQTLGRPYLKSIRQAEALVTVLEVLKPQIVAQRILVNASSEFTTQEKTDATQRLTDLQTRLDAL